MRSSWNNGVCFSRYCSSSFLFFSFFFLKKKRREKNHRKILPVPLQLGQTSEPPPPKKTLKRFNSSCLDPDPLQFRHSLPPILGSPGLTTNGTCWVKFIPVGGNGLCRFAIVVVSVMGDNLTTCQDLPYLSQHLRQGRLGSKLLKPVLQHLAQKWQTPLVQGYTRIRSS